VYIRYIHIHIHLYTTVCGTFPCGHSLQTTLLTLAVSLV